MSVPTIAQLLEALARLQAALVAEAAAKEEREQKAQAFADLLAAFRGGGLPAGDVADLTASLQAHAARLEALVQ